MVDLAGSERLSSLGSGTDTVAGVRDPGRDSRDKVRMEKKHDRAALTMSPRRGTQGTLTYPMPRRAHRAP